MTSPNSPMKQRQREAVLVELAEQLRAKDSWCGETHLQKAAFVLQSLADVPLGFDHILYKYGPFAYDLRDELTTMRADGFFEAERIAGYGPRLKPTEAAKRQLLAKWPRTVKRYKRHCAFVADKFGSKGVSELERLATALWVTEQLPGDTKEQQARFLNQVKPHVSVERALEALGTIETWKKQAEKLKAPPQRRPRAAALESRAPSRTLG